MNTSALVLAQASASFSRSELGWEFANITAAVVLLFLAFAALAFFCFRRGTRDPTLIYFALFCLLSGYRWSNTRDARTQSARYRDHDDGEMVGTAYPRTR